MTNENATYDECGDIDAFVKKAVDKCAYVKKGSVDATVVDKSQEHDVFVANDKNKETFVKTDEIANVGGAEVKAPPSLAVQTAAAVSSYDLFVNEHPVESFYVDEESSLIVNQQDNVDVELDEDFTGNHAINEAFLVNKKTDKNPLIIDPKTIQTELLVSKKNVHEELFASKKSDELMINKEGIHDELFAGLKQEREDVGNKILDVKHKNRLHTLTGDVKDSAVSGVKQGVKNTGKRAVKETMLAPATLTDKMVRDTQGEDAQEALSVLTGTKIKDTAEQAKDYYNKAMSPFATVGKVARAPRRVGEARATVKEHRATRKVKSAERKVKSVDKNIAKYQKRELQGKAGYRKGASVFEKKNQKKLVKARRQAGRATAKFQKAKFIRAKKRPVAWLFDGRAKSAVIKVLIPAAAMLLMIMLIVGAISAAFGVFGQENNKKNGSGYGDLEGNCLTICKFLREKDVPDMAIAAICGNIFGESGYRTDAIEYDDNGNTLEGRGLCQWSFGRRENLYNFAKSKDKEWSDLQVQLEFLWLELTTSYDLEGLKAQTDVEQATIFFHDDFEKSAAGCGQNRINEAKRVYEELQKGGGGNTEATRRAKDLYDRKVPYVFGAKGPDAYDCSSFVSYCLTGLNGGTLGNTDSFRANFTRISKEELKEGDVLCSAGHAGLYYGNNQVIECMDANHGIVISDLDKFISWNGGDDVWFLRYEG